MPGTRRRLKLALAYGIQLMLLLYFIQSVSAAFRELLPRIQKKLVQSGPAFVLVIGNIQDFIYGLIFKLSLAFGLFLPSIITA